jgi:hypothetical protein
MYFRRHALTYFYRFPSRLLLNKSSSFDDFGVPGIYMSVALLVAWLLICVCIFRGIQTSGKVSTLSFLPDSHHSSF